MTFQQCLSFSPFEIIWQQLSYVYPIDSNHKESYQKVYDEMLSITPVNSEYKIKVDFIDQYNEWHVYGINGTRLKDIPLDEGGVSEDHPKANELIQYAIEFNSRAEWAGMKIDSFTSSELSTLEIAVHCLWEMTFAGFDEDDVNKQKKLIEDRTKSIKDNPDDLVEVKEGIFCHKDMVDTMKEMLSNMDEKRNE